MVAFIHFIYKLKSRAALSASSFLKASSSSSSCFSFCRFSFSRMLNGELPSNITIATCFCCGCCHLPLQDVGDATELPAQLPLLLDDLLHLLSDLILSRILLLLSGVSLVMVVMDVVSMFVVRVMIMVMVMMMPGMMVTVGDIVFQT